MRRQEESLDEEYEFRSEHALLEKKILLSLTKQAEYDRTQCKQFQKTGSSFLASVSNVSLSDRPLCSLPFEDIQICGKEVRDGPSNIEIDLINSAKKKTSAEVPSPFPEPIPFCLNEEQAEFATMYTTYLENVNDPTTKPPPIVMLHGSAGTGKSAAIKTILRKADSLGLKVLRTSFNAINAVAIQGKTASSMFSIYGKHANNNEELTNKAYHSLLAEAKDAVLIVLDEVSTVAPHVLARISDTLCQVFNCSDPFGGLPIILAGDLSQMAPVKAKTLTESIMDIAAVSKNEKKPSRESKKKKKDNQEETLRSVLLPEKNGVIYAENRYAQGHPYSVGSKLFTQTKWFELSKIERSVDPVHTNLVTGIYKNGRLSSMDLKGYKHLSPSDFDSPDSPWLTASIIVSTNRERFSLTHEAAVRFARAKGKLVFRWMTNFSKWEGAPEDISGAVYEDPCFYEYFVSGAAGFITDRICAETNLVNGIPCTYDSFVLENQYDQDLVAHMLSHGSPGDIVTLSEAPLSLNVEIHPFTKDKDLFTDFHRDYFRFKSIGEGSKIIIPIVQGTNKQTENVLVHGGSTFSCSRMTVKNYFPVELAFAITVNKAQGRTIENVILALSKKPLSVCNMGLKELYVALSRVRTKDSIRLLLTGDSYLQKFESMSYIDTLRGDPTVSAFFAGFGEGGNDHWSTREWNQDIAFQYYKDCFAAI